MLAGRPISRVTRSMDVTASPSETPGARLKETVAAGNWPWWLTRRGALTCSMRVKALRGMTPAEPAALAVPPPDGVPEDPLPPPVVAPLTTPPPPKLLVLLG